MKRERALTIAVVGAGIAGAACASALMSAGHSVHVFDKSRGSGGRLATRRVEWADAHGQPFTTHFDHGALGITARSAAFHTFINGAVHAGWLAEWKPTLAAGSEPLAGVSHRLVPVPHMPSLCRQLLNGASTRWSFAVDRLHKSPDGWQVEAAGERLPLHFDAVILALPPAQAAPLLGPHHSDWAERASDIDMQPCWTLMGIADCTEPALYWDIAQPPAGPLHWLMRNEARPGRHPVSGQTHWVLHAKSDWSAQHLEQPSAWIQQHMQTALSHWLGQPVRWQHSLVHRWRYALPPVQSVESSESSWWDESLGLGVCGDFFGDAQTPGAEGVERAWLSAQSLCAALLQGESSPNNEAAESVVDDTIQSRIA